MAKQQPGAAAPVQAGALFGFPGYTQPLYQPETNDQTTVTLSATAQAKFSAAVPFKNTDVITAWELDLTITNTFTAGTITTTDAQAFPYNFLGPVTLSIQNMYPAIQVTDGLDLLLFELLHPTIRGAQGGDVRQYGGAAPGTTWASNTAVEANNVATASSQSSTTSIKLSLILPVCLMIDQYYDLSANGQVLMPPHRALVSPQWMAGISRSVRPDITYNALIGTTCDTSPYSVSGTTLGTASGSVLQGFQRRGYYGSNDPRVQPPVYNWQPQRLAKPYNIGAVTKFDINIPNNTGQILLMYLRFFDATAATNAPPAISIVTKCQVLYGSGLVRFDDTYITNQKRIYQQLGISLPKGVIAWVLAMDDFGKWNNALALNTYTTASPTIHLEFSGAQGAGFYAVLGIETLAYVQQ